VPIVRYAAVITHVGLGLGVAPFVVVLVANGCKSLGAVCAMVRLLARVRPIVHDQVTTLSESLSTVGPITVKDTWCGRSTLHLL